MNLYLISQTVNNGYDTYDSAVVCAKSEENARVIHPSTYNLKNEWWSDHWYCGDWTMPENVKVELIGTLINESAEDLEKEVICASFNAG